MTVPPARGTSCMIVAVIAAPFWLLLDSMSEFKVTGRIVPAGITPAVAVVWLLMHDLSCEAVPLMRRISTSRSGGKNTYIQSFSTRTSTRLFGAIGDGTKLLADLYLPTYSMQFMRTPMS